MWLTHKAHKPLLFCFTSPPTTDGDARLHPWCSIFARAISEATLEQAQNLPGTSQGVGYWLFAR